MIEIWKLSVVAKCCFLLTMLATDVSISKGEGQENPSQIETDCLLMALDHVELAAGRDGLLMSLDARIGEDVQAGQIVFRLSDEQSRARLDVAKAMLAMAMLKAENQWGIHAAKSMLEIASKETELLDEIGRTPYLERIRAASAKAKQAAELKLAESSHHQDLRAREVAEAQVDLARIDLKACETTSPINGTIDKQYRHAGQWCHRGDPVVRVLRMDRLMLQAIANLRDVPPHRVIGLKATARFQIPGEEPILINDLTIVRCSPEVDLDGNYFVWTFVDNVKAGISLQTQQWLLRPGISGILQIDRAE